MSLASPETIELPPLSRLGMARLVAGARRMGVPLAAYAKHLVEESLSLQLKAERSSFAEIMRPVREANPQVDEAEVVRLVDSARGRPVRRKRETCRTPRSG